MPVTNTLAISPAPPLVDEHLPSRRSALYVLEWLVLALAVAFAAGRAIPRSWRHLNTDFPNYYVTARLLREGYSLSRVYDWIWLQRQKDHMGILASDQPVVGFVPHTPFSALTLMPLARWPPLAAKHIWIALNLLVVAAIGVLLRSLTCLEWRHIALVIALNYPLLRNLEYGQYYIVILALLTAALWLYVRDRRLAAGVVVGVAAGLKIFPVFFGLYFLRKRDMPSLVGLAAGCIATVAASYLAFGLEVHRVYFAQVLPWALRGDAMNPYALSPSSLSALLHKLFIMEPQWNPHPAVFAPGLYAILHPLLQVLVLAPAILLASPTNRNGLRLQLEWSAFVLALLAISTLPASYHFTLLILPFTILASRFLRERKWEALLLLGLLYLAIGYPSWPKLSPDGWWALAAVPRLYLLLILCTLAYLTVLHRTLASDVQIDSRLWAAALCVALALQIVLTLRHQAAIYDGYGARLVLSPDILSASEPVSTGTGISFIALQDAGYVLGSVDARGVHLARVMADQLSHADAKQAVWTEEARAQSAIWQTEKNAPSRLAMTNAEFPIVSLDGKWLAYLRSDKGRGTLWVHSLRATQADLPLTTADFNVSEMTFGTDDSLIFAAARGREASALYRVGGDRRIQALNIAEARYPAASPDGRWLAYSRLQHGIQKLWITDLRTGESRRLTAADCNDISPAWEPDARSLIYSSDCGRALWFTALNRLQIAP